MIINIYNNVKVKIDSEDLDLVNSYKWHITDTGYVVTSKHIRIDKNKYTTKNIRLHRLIMGLPNGNIDHINGDKLDNRKSNLRLCNQSQNIANSKISKRNKSGLKGVFKHQQCDRWAAQIRINGKNTHLGLFNDKYDAYGAYITHAIEHFGEYANV